MMQSEAISFGVEIVDILVLIYAAGLFNALRRPLHHRLRDCVINRPDATTMVF